jgi:hypothetical protein
LGHQENPEGFSGHRESKDSLCRKLKISSVRMQGNSMNFLHRKSGKAHRSEDYRIFKCSEISKFLTYHFVYRYIKRVRMQNKKAISELIAYVLLVGLSIALSIAVYAWLRTYAIPAQAKTCPNGVGVIIHNYVCENGNITINLSNKGLFKIDGYIFRINNETDVSGNPAGLPVNLIATVTLPSSLNPGEMTGGSWKYKDKYARIVEMEIEPFRIEGKKNILCDKAVIRQRTTLVECN